MPKQNWSSAVRERSPRGLKTQVSHDAGRRPKRGVCSTHLHCFETTSGQCPADAVRARKCPLGTWFARFGGSRQMSYCEGLEADCSNDKINLSSLNTARRPVGSPAGSQRTYPIHSSAGGRLGGLPHNGDSRKKINSSLLYLTFPLGSAIMNKAPRKALRPQKLEAVLGTSPVTWSCAALFVRFRIVTAIVFGRRICGVAECDFSLLSSFLVLSNFVWSM
jgi:hypothetical protein